jgi:CubicO group peptidase (beta-lactamase class C family)
MRNVLTVFCAVGLVGCGAPSAAPVVSASNPAMDRVIAHLRPAITIKGAPAVTYALADRMAKFKVPGVSIAVVDSGRIVWNSAYGLKEAGTTDSVTTTTLFQAASISKPVAATAMLRLVEQGTLALDTPVNQYLKSWKVPDNRFTATQAVTLRRIVSHSAGLGVHGFPGYARGEPLPTVPQILDGAKPANTAAVRVESVPGSTSSYSGGGITIEQLVMTDVTGESFPALVQRLVLDPIGMTSSGYDQPLPAAKVARAATGHRPDGTPVQGRWHTYPEMAAAGLWTTPTDLAKWAIAITASRNGVAGSVLSKKSATDMLTVQKEPAGLGPMLQGTGRAFRFEHGGSNTGYICHVIYFPELGRGAAVMTNSDAGSSLTNEILFALAKEYDWPEYGPREVQPIALDSATVRQLVGEYPVPAKLTDGRTVSQTIRNESGRLMVEVPGFVPKTALVALADNVLLAPESGFEFHMLRDAAGRVTGIDIGSARLTKKK